MKQFSVNDFDFELPHAAIATHPVYPRESAKLFCYGNTNPHQTCGELLHLLKAGDILVLNNTKVIPARITATRPRMQEEGNVTFEFLLHRPLGSLQKWEAFVRPAKRLKEGQELTFAEGVKGIVLSREGDRCTFKWEIQEEEVYPFLERVGEMPLPPYIEREDGAEVADKEDYQTVYANEEGAVAAPTAGLHFSEELLDKLQQKGIQIAYVTLHVGAGTFQPVRVENIAEHIMHSERGYITPEIAAQITTAKANGGRVVAVGTTSLRLLESASKDGVVKPFNGETDIFITPGYQFQIVDNLLTNFHLPKSTLMMLVAALMGYEEMMDMYKLAIENSYRFYSYGDACFLERK